MAACASLGWLFADAAAPVVGCAAGLGIHISPGFIGTLLGFFAGSFLFIGAAHLLPEAEHEGKSPWLYFAVVAGFAFVVVIGQLLGHAALGFVSILPGTVPILRSPRTNMGLSPLSEAVLRQSLDRQAPFGANAAHFGHDVVDNRVMRRDPLDLNVKRQGDKTQSR